MQKFNKNNKNDFFTNKKAAILLFQKNNDMMGQAVQKMKGGTTKDAAVAPVNTQKSTAKNIRNEIVQLQKNKVC